MTLVMRRAGGRSRTLVGLGGSGSYSSWTPPMWKSSSECAYISRIKRYLDTIRYDTIGGKTLSLYVSCAQSGSHASTCEETTTAWTRSGGSCIDALDFACATGGHPPPTFDKINRVAGRLTPYTFFPLLPIKLWLSLGPTGTNIGGAPYTERSRRGR